MTQAIYRHGEPIMCDYTPGAGNVSAGDMVVLGSVTANTAGTGALLIVAHKDIVNSTLGAMAFGGGVYACQVASNYAAGSKVFKPSGNAILTTTSTNNAQFGWTVETSAAANAVVKVIHKPYASGP